MQMEAAQTRMFYQQEEKRRKEEDLLELKRIEMDRQFQLQMFQLQAKLQMEMMSLFGQQLSSVPSVPKEKPLDPRGDGDSMSSQLEMSMNCTDYGNNYHYLP